MKPLAWMLAFSVSFHTVAQEGPGPDAGAKGTLFRQASELFAQGKYNAASEELSAVERRLLDAGGGDKAQLGLVYYWKAIALNRNQNFPDAVAYFGKALQLGYAPKDIHYEYGQALFAADQLPEARLQFRESMKKKHKRAVALYYIAFISRELGEKKKAITFFKAIDKLGPDEAKEVRQASEMQIGDIYLEQTEKHPDAFRAVQAYVIPQYEKALALDDASPLAPEIKEKIVKLQRKYDLILFQLMNGRPTLQPPHFLRLAQEIGRDTNVTYAPTETTIAKAKQGSMFSKTDVLGRYTFYYKNFISVSPELRFNYTYYFNRVPEIYRNDNYLIAPALRTTYEHVLWKKPASVLFDYDYNDAHRDIDADKDLEFGSRSHTLMLGERFNYFAFGETILRVRRRLFESYASASDSETTSFTVEQIRAWKQNTFLFYLGYDRTRVKNDAFDTDGVTLRTDFIMARVRDWFTPSVGLAVTSTDPVNARSTRGRELLLNPNLRLSKTLGKQWRTNFKYDYQKNSSKDEANFAFKKDIVSLEVEYLF